MLNQLQFNLDDARAPAAVAPTAPVDVPSPGPSPQQQKLEQNRQRITGQGNPRPAGGGTETVPIHRFDLQDAGWDQYEFDMQEPLIHDTYNWRTHGKTEFVNLVGDDAVKMVQDTVDPARVKQLIQNPSLGSDPRFPGPELPKVLQRSSGTHEVINGTHRIAALQRNDQRRLFTEARVMHEGDVETPPPLMQQARNIRENVAYKRYTTKDPGANL